MHFCFGGGLLPPPGFFSKITRVSSPKALYLVTQTQKRVKKRDVEPDAQSPMAYYAQSVPS